jgi:hypothetical protein
VRSRVNGDMYSEETLGRVRSREIPRMDTIALSRSPLRRVVGVGTRSEDILVYPNISARARHVRVACGVALLFRLRKRGGMKYVQCSKPRGFLPIATACPQGNLSKNRTARRDRRWRRRCRVILNYFF